MDVAHLSPAVRPPRPRFRRGFSLIELLVVLALIGILLALLLPAVQQSRESARRLQCQSNLRQLGIAVHNYESTHGMIPPGITMGHSWMAQILPYVDRDNLYQQIDYGEAYFGHDHPIEGVVVPLFLCPSDGTPPNSPGGQARNSYAGNFGTGVLEHGYNGLFQHIVPNLFGSPLTEGPVRWRDVTDGLSNTAMISELLMGDGTSDMRRVNWYLETLHQSLSDLKAACLAETPRFHADGSPFGSTYARGYCWLSGDVGATRYNHTFGPMRPSCYNGAPGGIYSAASEHREGVYLLFADGHVQFIHATIDEAVWTAWGSRNGSEPVTAP